ncbi:MAG: HDOD domain-containing protein [Pseudomonadota bacterium]
MSKEKVLFVDDESCVLDGLRRALRHRRREWDMAFAMGGQAAIDMLDDFQPTVVVSDMRMPGMDGAAVLTEVKARLPGTVRIVLSGNSDTASIMRAVGPSHQYLSKPCDTTDLDNAIARTRALRDMLNHDALARRMTGFEELPSLPSTYERLISALKSSETSIVEVADIIASDIAMTAKVLKLVNSAYFGIPRNVTDIHKAVSFLGMETIAALVLGHGAFAAMRPAPDASFDFEGTIAMAMRTAAAARTIATYENFEKRIINDAFLAGMLGYIGQIIVATSLPEEYRAVVDASASATILDVDVELSEAGARFDEMGAYLMGLWSLPDTVVEAAAYRKRPGSSAVHEPGALTAAHIAYCVCNSDDAGEPPDIFDTDYLNSLELRGDWQAWSAACKQAVEDAA